MTAREPQQTRRNADGRPRRRVLMLAPSYLPRAGGVEKHIRLVARELLARGHEIRIATPRWEQDWAAEETLDEIPVRRLALDKRAGRRELIDWAAWADIVHTHDAYPFLKYYLPFRLRGPRKPVFATFHGYEGYPIPLEARLLRRIVLWLTRGSICAGAFIPKWYRFRCTHVTHGGVDAPDHCPPVGEGAVFVGRLEADTGFMGALAALRILKERHGIDLPVAVCGDGSLRAEGREFATVHGLPVTFHGFVPDVMPHICAARFAFTSGLLGMLEAMASGSVVLATYDNPLKEDYLRLFPGAGHICIAGTPGEMAQEVARLMSDPDGLQSCVDAAFDFARTQTWAAVADLYEGLWGCVA